MIADIVRERGPLTVAAFMDLALYHPELGYYARAARRTGRAGDFFTSVDVGSVFGELLEVQVAEMAGLLRTDALDLVEAGAADGRLTADILAAMHRRDPLVFQQVRPWLVEASGAARQAHAGTLAAVFDRPFTTSADLPSGFEGVLIANELLDALPVHQVVMRADGLREVFVAAPSGTAALTTIEAPPSTPLLAEYLEQLGVVLEPGWRVEINLRAVEWTREAARRLRRGFIVLIDYGHEARDLYSLSHAAGTLTTYARHAMRGQESPAGAPPWLDRPGEQDITAHVDFTSVRAAAETEGLTTLGFLDQTYFLLGLIGEEGLAAAAGDLHQRLALKTLLMPGGLGSTMKVLILAKSVGSPMLRGCSYRVRAT